MKQNDKFHGIHDLVFALIHLAYLCCSLSVEFLNDKHGKMGQCRNCTVSALCHGPKTQLYGVSGESRAANLPCIFTKNRKTTSRQSVGSTQPCTHEKVMVWTFAWPSGFINISSPLAGITRALKMDTLILRILLCLNIYIIGGHSYSRGKHVLLCNVYTIFSYTLWIGQVS